MACRRAAAVARRCDILTSAAAVPSALDGRVRRRLLDGCGFGAVGSTGMGLGGRLKFASGGKTLVPSPNFAISPLPHCTHRCRPETRDGLSTSRLRRSGIAGCRAALPSGESLKLGFEGKRVPARRARSPELGSQSPVSDSCVATRSTRDSAAAGRQTARSRPTGRDRERRRASTPSPRQQPTLRESTP
jgi:hypothetical protein